MVSYCEHLGKCIRSLGTCQKCIKNLGCSHIGNLMWTYMINNLVCTWWKTLRTSKSKKFKTPINSQKEKNLILGCMLHHLISKAKFLSPKMFVIFFQLDLMPHSLMSFRWTIISYTTLNLECHNLSLRLVTKARAYKGVSQKGSPRVTSHAFGSVGECEGMNHHTPKWAPTLGVGVPMDFWIFEKQL